MSIVYVVQRQRFRERGTGDLRDKFDLTSAEDYGELRFLLGPQATPYRPRPTIEALREGLAEITNEDYILLIGNPCLIGWTVALAVVKTGGRVRLLQWHAQSKSYLVIDSDLGECPGGAG